MDEAKLFENLKKMTLTDKEKLDAIIEINTKAWRDIKKILED